MKKILSIAFVAAFLAASIGCDDKKTSAPAKGSATGSASAPAASSPATK